MRGLVAAVTLAVAGLAHGQVFSEVTPTWAPGMPPYFGALEGSFLNGGSTPALYLPLNTNGGTFPETAGTVSHLTWNGSALQEGVAGVNWSMNGTVPQVAASSSPFSPGKAGAGPYSAANNYSGPTTVGEWAGDWSVTVVWTQTTATVLQMLVAKSNAASTQGWSAYVSATGKFTCFIYDGAIKNIVSTNSVEVNGINVGTCGRVGGTAYARLNSVTAFSAAVGTMTAGSAESMRVGRNASTNYATESTIYEVIASTDAYSDALHLDRWRRAVGLYGTRQEVISLTRATTRTCEVNGVTWNVANDAPCVNTSGILVERASTNYVLNNRTHPKAAEATGALSTGAHVAWHEGTGTMTVAAGTATVTGLSCTAVSPGTLCTFTVTVGGTMAITTSAGTVTKAQIETGSTKTSEIPTAGTAVARNADVASVPWPTLPNTDRWCVEDTLTPYGGRSWDVGAVTRGYFSIGTPGAANSAWVFTNGTGLWGQLYDNASATRDITWTHGYASGSTHLVKLCNDGVTLRLYSDGVLVGSDSTGGTGTWGTAPTTLYPHGTGGAQPSGDAYNRTIKVYRSASGR